MLPTQEEPTTSDLKRCMSIACCSMSSTPAVRWPKVTPSSPFGSFPQTVVGAAFALHFHRTHSSSVPPLSVPFHLPRAAIMPPKARKTKQQIDDELEFHIASDWADFRRFAPKKEIVLDEVVLCFNEGPFWGFEISSVPHWYLDYLCSGGENFLLWKDEVFATAVSKMGYRKVDAPPIQAPGMPPVASFLWPKIPPSGPSKTTPETAAQIDSELMPPPPRPRSAAPTFDYSALAKMARDPADECYLLTAEDATEAATGGPGLHLQSELDVSPPETMCATDMTIAYSGAGHTTQPSNAYC
ncbi:uncharacterized protein CC84DRAFT_1180591 [Paraphaeosphaeria sporulosa]|uniref:Uncharacterized protein n=1 Tax=Paraphaeosphaeria sporulosa TaxID=1460663 RepID=A0A177BZK9_9PLEO|nr:uncharacterized protein CC84DRAFT_1180591 [Paraphaeosphaeria sporulosa]OAG00596.1 hypothetical protein CC84DRAFT_1180591 [Paraphaeosphaeria sporulosa]